jgi:hypothetical protein
VPAPSNISAATATAIGTLPYSTTQDVNDSGTTYTVWYSYAASTTSVISVWARGDNLAYTVEVGVYTGSAGSPTQYLSFHTVAIQNTPIQVPVTAGNSYFFQFSSNDGDVSPALLQLDVQAAPNTSTIPAGSLAINDENEGYPLTIRSGTTGEVIRFITPFPSGEYGAPMSDGRIAIEDHENDRVTIYANLASVANVTFPRSPGSRQVIATNRTTKFYLGNQGSGGTAAFVRRTSTTGVFDAPTWTLAASGLSVMVPNLTDTILYYANAGYGEAIKRWDLVNDVALSDFAAGVSGYLLAPDMHVLSDGTILAGYIRNTTSNPSFMAKRLNAAGTVLNTYSYNWASTTTVRLAIGQDDPTSFWLKRHTPGSTVQYLQVRVSDGATLQTFDGTEFTKGAHAGHFNADDPDEFFGNAASCPFWITGESIVPTESTPTPPTTTADCPCPPPDSRGPGGSSSGPTGSGPFGGGGSSRSGTNEGGDGWVAHCPDPGGTVNSYATASAGESMVGKRDPRIWAEIAFQTYSGTTPTAAPEYWSQDVTIPDAAANYGGRKDGRILGISKISRSLSDDNGNYSGSKVTVSLNDKDRASLRTRLGTASSKFVWDREGIIRIASETNRRTGYSTAPRELFRGVSKDVELAAKFNGSISFEDRVCSQFGQFGPDRTFSSRLLTTGLFPGCPRELVGKPQQWIFGEVSDAGATHPSTGQPNSKGLVPMWLIGTVGSEDAYHIAAHECVEVFEVYGSDGGVDDAPPMRVLLSSGDYRVETEDVTDTVTGLTHRVTTLYISSTHIASVAHKNGSLNMACNVCGVAGANGQLITDLFLIYQYVFEHVVLPNQESLTGAYVGSPQWADGRYMLHSDSFAAAQEYSAQRIGGSGYQGAFVLGGGHGAVTLRELLKRMSNSGDCWFTWSHGGQLKVALLDDTSDVSSSTIYTEPGDLRTFPTPYFEFDEVENPVLFSYDFDDDKQKMRVAQEQIEDPIAWAKLGRPRPSPSPIAMRCVRDEATARDVAARRLMRRKYPPAYYPVTLSIDGIGVEPGDIIRITSQEGVGNGSDERALFVRDWSFDPKTMRTSLLCRDLTDLLVDNILYTEAGTDAFILHSEDSEDALALR